MQFECSTTNRPNCSVELEYLCIRVSVKAVHVRVINYSVVVLGGSWRLNGSIVTAWFLRHCNSYTFTLGLLQCCTTVRGTLLESQLKLSHFAGVG